MSTLRPPGFLAAPTAGESGLSVLEHEMLAEKAASLGRAGDKAARDVARLKSCQPDSPERPALLKQAAASVHGFFIQRELCGLRRHADIIRELGIPPEVLARLGAA